MYIAIMLNQLNNIAKRFLA